MARAAKTALIATILVVIPSIALAGGYVGGSVGGSYVKLKVEDIEGIAEDFELSGADIAYKVFGGYKPIPFFSLEGGYRNLGKVTDTEDDVEVGIETKGWDVEAMGILPLGIAHAWAKAGFFFWNSEPPGGSQGESDSGTDFMWGLGGDFSILKIALRLEWEKFEIEGADHISMLSAGVTFGF